MSKLKKKEELEDLGDLPNSLNKRQVYKSIVLTVEVWHVCELLKRSAFHGLTEFPHCHNAFSREFSTALRLTFKFRTSLRLKIAETSSFFTVLGASAAGLKVASARLPSPKTLVGSPAQILAQFPKQQSPKHLQQSAPLGTSSVSQTHTTSTSPVSKPTIQIKQESGRTDQFFLQVILVCFQFCPI